MLSKVRRNICEEWDASTNPQCAYDLFLSTVSRLLPCVLHLCQELVACLHGMYTGGRLERQHLRNISTIKT